MVAWMPAGRSLLVRDGSPEEGTPYGIFQIDRETSKRNQVTHAPSGIGDSAFDVSPDGRSLAFVRYERPGIGDVYVALIAGRDAHRRTNWNTEISGVAWTPDGRDLVYAVLEEPGLDPTVFRIPASGNRLDRGVRALHVSAESLSMSRPPPGESGRLAFTTGRIDVALRLVDLQGPLTGGVFQRVRRFADSTRLDVPGPFSKDGERVAFRSDRNGWARVWLANRDGSGVQPLTTLKATELVIGGWSRDGSKIVIDAAVDGNSDVYVVYLDGQRTAAAHTPRSGGRAVPWRSLRSLVRHRSRNCLRDDRARFGRDRLLFLRRPKGAAAGPASVSCIQVPRLGHAPRRPGRPLGPGERYRPMGERHQSG